MIYCDLMVAFMCEPREGSREVAIFLPENHKNLIALWRMFVGHAEGEHHVGGYINCMRWDRKPVDVSDVCDSYFELVSLDVCRSSAAATSAR